MFEIGSDEWPGAAKLIEECGETLQVLGKLIAIRGGSDHFDGSNLHERLREELADLWAALAFFISHSSVNADAVEGRMREKFALFNEWHDEIQAEIRDRQTYGDPQPGVRTMPLLESEETEFEAWHRAATARSL
jgi:hypothetical protein